VSAFDELAGLEPLVIWDGVHGRSIAGERCAFAIVELDPDAVVSEHRHEHEQLGMVISGSVRFRVEHETQELGPGGTWRIPSNAPHEVQAGPEGAVVFDVFAPAREDWGDLERQPPREPRWPRQRSGDG
jgi:quercetin dioxygenase-like cupin family protein